MLKFRRHTDESLRATFELSAGTLESALWEAHVARRQFFETAQRYVRIPLPQNNTRFVDASEELVVRVTNFFDVVTSDLGLERETKARTIADFLITDGEQLTDFISSLHGPKDTSAAPDVRKRLVDSVGRLIEHIPDDEIAEELGEGYGEVIEYHGRVIERMAEDSQRGAAMMLGITVAGHVLDVVKVGLGIGLSHAVAHYIKSKKTK